MGFYRPDIFLATLTINVKSLQGTQSLNPNQWPGLIERLAASDRHNYAMITDRRKFTTK